MTYVTIIVSLCAAFFLIQLLRTNRQIKLMTKQLENYNKQGIEKKLDIALSNKRLETLAVEVNDTIAGVVEANANTYRVERELKQAIGGMSHDLRTPLTTIIGYMQLIKKKDLPEATKSEHLAVAQKRAHHLLALIDHLFDLSNAADYPIQWESVDISPLVKEIILSYYDQFEAANKRPIIDIPSKERLIITDRSAFKRVVENLILNAIQHSAGDISIHLGEQEGMAVLTIVNKVAHSENLEIARLFERFYTADQTRKHSGGIGLTIVRNLMDRMDGAISATLDTEEITVECKWELAN